MGGALAHRANKWIRLSAMSDAPLKDESTGSIQNGVATFGSDALGAARAEAIEGRPEQA
jgi:hypothetical protein